MKTRTKTILLLLGVITLAVTSFLLGKGLGINYTLDNQHVELIEDTSGVGRYDYNIYLDDKLVRVYD